MGFGTNEQRGMDGIRKNEREVHEVKCFRNGVNLFRKAILIKRTFLRCGVLSLFSRSSLGVRSVE